MHKYIYVYKEQINTEINFKKYKCIHTFLVVINMRMGGQGKMILMIKGGSKKNFPSLPSLVQCLLVFL